MQGGYKMKCPKCKAENKEGSKYCMRCGFNLVQKSDIKSISDVKINVTSNNTSNVGTPSLKDQSFIKKLKGLSFSKICSEIIAFISKGYKHIKDYVKKLPKKVLIPISAVIIILFVGIIVIKAFFSPPNFKDGNYWKNISKFGASSDGLSPVTKEYSKLISYTVESQGADSREKGWIEIRVGVPDVSKELIDIMNSDQLSIDGNTNEEMTESLSKYIAERFKNGHYKYSYETFRLDLERDGLEWKIVPTQELSDFMYAPIYEAYREALRQQFEHSDPPESTIPEDDTEDGEQGSEE